MKRIIKAFAATLIIIVAVIYSPTRIGAGCGSILVAIGEDNAEVIRTCSLAEKYVKL